MNPFASDGVDASRSQKRGMIRRAMGSLVLVLLPLIVLYYANGSSNGHPSNSPLLSVESLHINDHWCGETIHGTIRLKNKSGGDVTLDRVKTYCGCIERVDAGELPRTILAGQSVALACLLKLPTSESTIDQKMELYLRESRQPVEARITGRAIAPIPPLIDLGVFHSPLRREITMRTLDDRPSRTLRAVRCLQGPLNVSSMSTTRFTLTTDPALPLGTRLDALLEAEYADDGLPVQRLRVVGRASNGLTADNDPVVFGRIALAASPPSREVIIEDIHRRPLHLVAPHNLPDILRLEMAPENPWKVRCRLIVQPRQPMKVDESLTLTDVSGDRAVVLTCVGVAE